VLCRFFVGSFEVARAANRIALLITSETAIVDVYSPFLRISCKNDLATDGGDQSLIRRQIDSGGGGGWWSLVD